MFFADTINVGQIGGPAGAYTLLTLYQTIPNARTGKTEFYVSARIQVPIQAALALPNILINQMLSLGDVSKEDLEFVIGQSREILRTFEAKLKEKDV